MKEFEEGGGTPELESIGEEEAARDGDKRGSVKFGDGEDGCGLSRSVRTAENNTMDLGNSKKDIRGGEDFIIKNDRIFSDQISQSSTYSISNETSTWVACSLESTINSFKKKEETKGVGPMGVFKEVNTDLSYAKAHVCIHSNGPKENDLTGPRVCCEKNLSLDILEKINFPISNEN